MASFFNSEAFAAEDLDAAMRAVCGMATLVISESHWATGKLGAAAASVSLPATSTKVGTIVSGEDNCPGLDDRCGGRRPGCISGFVPPVPGSAAVLTTGGALASASAGT